METVVFLLIVVPVGMVIIGVCIGVVGSALEAVFGKKR